jgi:hypothetical protein
MKWPGPKSSGPIDVPFIIKILFKWGWQIHFRDCKSVQVTIKKFDFGSAIFFGYIKVHMGLLFYNIKKLSQQD